MVDHDGRHFSDAPFGKTLAHLLGDAGVSLRALGRGLDLDVAHLSRLRSGKTPAPPDATIRRFAQAFKVPPEYFLEYRVRRVAEALEGDPPAATALFIVYSFPPPRRKPIMDQVLDLIHGEGAGGR
jgi:transcriptional regulator with XRE-family HTH domain